MVKGLVKVLAAICVLQLSSTAALAETNLTSGDSVQPSTNKMDWKALPKQTAGFIAGAIIGTPVCMFRKSKDEERMGIQGMVGNATERRFVIPAAVFWFPFAVFTGFAEAPAYAIKESIIYADKPFSKEQFSLGEMK